MRLYLDAAPVIYLIEENEDFSDRVDQILKNSDVEPVASDLTRLECRTKPIKENDRELLKDYDAFFSDIVNEIVQLSKNVMDRATKIRADHGFRTPDAIHLAAAVISNCDAFLTNDLRLERFPDIVIQSISS
jgi:predicted nucleic acid-binding protein